MANERIKTFRRRGLIGQKAEVIIPTRLVITYRFKLYDTTKTGTDPYFAAVQPAPVLSAYGIVRNRVNANDPSTCDVYGVPVLLNSNQSTDISTDVLFDTEETTNTMVGGEAGFGLETSQEIMLDNEYSITNFVAQLNGAEHIARIREVILFGRPESFDEESEYRLT